MAIYSSMAFFICLQCIEPTWYISIDMQFYLIAPFIIFPLRRFGFRFIPVVCLIVLASLGFIFGYSIAQRFHFNDTPVNYMKYVYYASHARITQWLVGIILGFLLYKKESKMSNIHKVFNWSTLKKVHGQNLQNFQNLIQITLKFFY